MSDGNSQNGTSGTPNFSGFGNFSFFGGNVSYVSSVSSATNMTVLLQLAAIGLALTLIGSLSAIAFIMRYEPLKILSDRD